MEETSKHCYTNSDSAMIIITHECILIEYISRSNKQADIVAPVKYVQ